MIAKIEKNIFRPNYDRETVCPDYQTPYQTQFACQVSTIQDFSFLRKRHFYFFLHFSFLVLGTFDEDWVVDCIEDVKMILSRL